MEIFPTSKIISPAPPPLPTSIKDWKVGQIVEIKTTGTVKNGMVELELNGEKLLATSDKMLSANQKLLVKITSIGANTTFSVIKENTPEQLLPLETIIKSAIPKQDTIAPLINNLIYLLKNPAILKMLTSISIENKNPTAELQQVPQIKTTTDNHLLNLINNITAKIPSSQSLIPNANNTSTAAVKVLKDFIANSGLNFENKLLNSPKANQGKIIDSDLKGSLEKLVKFLKVASKFEAESGKTTEKQTKDTKLRSITSTLSKPINIAETLKALKNSLSLPITTTNKKIDHLLPDSQLLQIKPPPPLLNYPISAKAQNNASLEGLIGTKTLLAEITNQTEAALSRIQLSQTNLTQPDGNIHIMVDIPVLHEDYIDIFHLRAIEEDEATDKDEKKRKNRRQWSIELAFDIPPLGPISTKIKLGTQSIDASIWAEQKETVAYITEFLPSLNAKLSALGLVVDNLSCFCGSQPKTNQPQNTQGSFHEKA